MSEQDRAQNAANRPDESMARATSAAASADGVSGASAADATTGRHRPRFSRRALLTGTGLGVLGGALAGGGATWAATHPAGDSVDLGTQIPFYGQQHPVGIATPPQRYAMYMTFNLTTSSVKDLQTLLARWSAAASLMQRGDPVGSVEPDSENGLPKDTGEAYGLDPASLTITFGLGPAIFAENRFGLERFRPALLADLPTLPSDNLDPALVGGDLSVQACADDPQVAYHAVRNLARMGRSQVSVHWTQMGFGRASAGTGQETPRNLMGFKDGTRNVSTPEQFDEFVWVNGGDQSWLEGGTYQVVRKIRMNLETWDADRIGDQETIFGRTKAEGAPLTGSKEFDTPDFQMTDESGDRVIDPTAHIALAAYENNGGIRILRRPYNYTDGLNEHAQLDAGLLFLTYQNDPGHFAALQRRLGASDLLNEYISHIGTGVFAVPPSPAEGRYIAQELFES